MKKVTKDQFEKVITAKAKAFKTFVAYSEIHKKSSKASNLLGNKAAGKIFNIEAEIQFKKWKRQLNKSNKLVVDIFSNLSKDQQLNVDKFFKDGKGREVIEETKNKFVLELINSNISLDNAKLIIRDFGKTSKLWINIKSLKDFQKRIYSNNVVKSKMRFGSLKKDSVQDLANNFFLFLCMLYLYLYDPNEFYALLIAGRIFCECGKEEYCDDLFIFREYCFSNDFAIQE